MLKLSSPDAVAVPAARTRGATRRRSLVPAQLALLVVVLVAWYGLTSTELLPPFFFGEPVKVFAVLWGWFVSGKIYLHLGVTLLETLLAFVLGTLLGLLIGLWLGLSATASALLDPYIKAVNSMPRVVMAPIFAVWFGL